jgi:hypothetical protein
MRPPAVSIVPAPVPDADAETLDDFGTQTWAPTHGVTLAPKTRKHYALLYDHHIGPMLGLLQLRAIRGQTIQRWLSVPQGPGARRRRGRPERKEAPQARGFFRGGARGTRTPDLLGAIEPRRASTGRRWTANPVLIGGFSGR